MIWVDFDRKRASSTTIMRIRPSDCGWRGCARAIASSATLAKPSTAADQCSRSARSRAARPSASRVRWSSASDAQADANWPSLRTSTPVSPSTTESRRPGTSNPIPGVPRIAASVITIPQPSIIAGCSSIQAEHSSRCFSSSDTRPVTTTPGPARASMRARSGPSPAITSWPPTTCRTRSHSRSSRSMRL